MKTIGKMAVLSLVVSSVLFGATATTNVDVQTLAREISQTSDPAQRAEMMNDIKSSLANMNEAQREDALKGIRDGMEREHENSQNDMSSRGQGKEKGHSSSAAKEKQGSDNVNNNEIGTNNKEGSGTENSDNSSHNGNHDNQNAGNGGDHGGGDAGNSGGGNSNGGDAGNSNGGNSGAGDAGSGGSDHGGGDAGDSNGGNHD